MNIKIEITLSENRGVSVTGPLEDKILMYGLLEIAKNIVMAHKKEGNILKVPPGAKLAEVRNN
jgi:shikimate kinase